MPKPLRALSLAGLIAASCAKAPPEAPDPRPSGTGAVQVTMTGFENARGQVLIALFLDRGGWPDDESVAFGSQVLTIDGHEAFATFDDVPAGPFAISVFHDENEDRQLDTGLFGIPTEDYGFSRDARDTFGPPGFDDAMLELAPGESKQIAIQVK